MKTSRGWKERKKHPTKDFEGHHFSLFLELEKIILKEKSLVFLSRLIKNERENSFRGKYKVFNLIN